VFSRAHRLGLPAHRACLSYSLHILGQRSRTRVTFNTIDSLLSPCVPDPYLACSAESQRGTYRNTSLRCRTSANTWIGSAPKRPTAFWTEGISARRKGLVCFSSPSSEGTVAS